MARQGRGSIAKKKDAKGRDIYYIVLDVTDGAGKRCRKWLKAGPDWKVAQQILTAELAKLDAGISTVNTPKETLAAFLQRWLNTMKGTLSPRTYEGYGTILKRVIPEIGNIQLKKLGPADIQGYIATMLGEGGRYDKRGALSAQTVVHHVRLLHKCLQDAMAWGLIPRNPCDLVSAPRAKSKGLSIMTENEIKAFLAAAHETDYGVLFHVFLYTGARRSEVLALRWCDFDPALCKLSITRSIHRLRGGEIIFQPTKSDMSKRTIDLDPITVDVLQRHKEQVFSQCLDLGVVLKDTDLIFSRYDGQPLLPDTISHAWTKLAKKLGIPASNLHLARHSHASLLLKQGTDYKTIQARLGHSTPAVTLNVYSHTVAGLQREAAIRFAEALRDDIL